MILRYKIKTKTYKAALSNKKQLAKVTKVESRDTSEG